MLVFHERQYIYKDGAIVNRCVYGGCGKSLRRLRIVRLAFRPYGRPGKSWSQIMRLRSLGLGEFEIVHEVGDNVLYHAQSWAASPKKVWVRYGDQSLVWIAATKCSQ